MTNYVITQFLATHWVVLVLVALAIVVSCYAMFDDGGL